MLQSRLCKLSEELPWDDTHIGQGHRHTAFDDEDIRAFQSNMLLIGPHSAELGAEIVDQLDRLAGEQANHRNNAEVSGNLETYRHHVAMLKANLGQLLLGTRERCPGPIAPHRRSGSIELTEPRLMGSAPTP